MAECRPRAACHPWRREEEGLPNEANLEVSLARKGIELGAFDNTFEGLELSPAL